MKPGGIFQDGWSVDSLSHLKSLKSFSGPFVAWRSSHLSFAKSWNSWNLRKPGFVFKTSAFGMKPFFSEVQGSSGVSRLRRTHVTRPSNR